MIPRLYSLYVESTGITTDTRDIRAGNIFFALKGPSFNGNDFAAQAIHDGCAYAVVDEWREAFQGMPQYILVEDALQALQELARYHRNKLKIPVIGLTGSNGKTTTKELIRAVLSQRYRCFATAGNLNNHIGVPLSLLQVNQKHEIAVIEMGANHRKEIAFLCSICKPDYGLITNIGLAHLEGFGGEEGVYQGKKELFDYLGREGGKLFVNADDPKVVRAAENIAYTDYGSAPEALYQGSLDLRDERLHITWWRKDRPAEQQEIQTRLIGSYNFTNVMAAIAIGRYFGVSHAEIKAGIEGYHPKNQRSQLEQTPRGNLVIVDCYNANPSSMEAAIENLWKHGHTRKLLVLGDMLELGPASDEKHREILERLRQMEFKEVILVGEAFARANASFGFPSFIETDEAAAHLKKHPAEGALILLKGSRKKKLETLLELL